MQEFKVRRAQEGMTLIDFVAVKIKQSKRTTKQLLDRRVITVNQAPVWMAKHKLSTGDLVTLPDATTIQGDRKQGKIKILHQTDQFLIAAKPSNIVACNAKGSLEILLQRQTGIASLQAAHRLDKDTSGCLIFAKSASAKKALIKVFQAQQVNKTYHAIVHGHMKRGEHRVSKPIGGRTAVSHVRVLDTSTKAAHVAVKIETGRTHQIRIHMASIRHPVLGDRRYASADQMTQGATITRQMLHAKSLKFPDPYSGEIVHVSAPLPTDFSDCLRAFKLT